MKTSLVSLDGNRVKLVVEVDEAEVDKAIDGAFRRMAGEVNIPGFRRGKAPRRILEARFGTDVARKEALREALPGYYSRALDEHDVDAIAPPEIDITGGEETGSVTFDAVVEVRPHVSVAGYANLRVSVASPEVAESDIDSEIERLRAQDGELVVVDRPARDGDYVTIDITGSVDGQVAEGMAADDYLYEVGSGGVVPELDDELRGVGVGGMVAFDHTHPEDGEITSFRALVKEIKEKSLPEVDDEWANEASEFETLAELRADIDKRLAGFKNLGARYALHQGVLAALADLVDEVPSDALIDTEVERQASQLVGRLEAQGVTVEQWLAATGKAAEDVTAELRTQAVGAVKVDLGLRAVVAAEGIAIDDDELDEAVRRLSAQVRQSPEKLRRQLDRNGGIEGVRSEATKNKAIEWLADHAEVVDEEGRPVDRALLEAPSAIPDPPEGAEENR